MRSSVSAKQKNQEIEYTYLFGYDLGSYPFRYLGIPMHYCKLCGADWSVIEDRFKRKLSNWKAKHLSYGGRLNTTSYYEPAVIDDEGITVSAGRNTTQLCLSHPGHITTQW